MKCCAIGCENAGLYRLTIQVWAPGETVKADDTAAKLSTNLIVCKAHSEDPPSSPAVLLNNEYLRGQLDATFRMLGKQPPDYASAVFLFTSLLEETATQGSA